MANPISQIFTCLWSIVVGSSRILLFLGCLVLGVVQIIRLSSMPVLMLERFQAEDMVYATSSYNPFYNPASMLMFAIFGAVSSFFNHSTFKVFPIVLVLCVMCNSFELSREYDMQRVKGLDRRFSEKFNRSMQEYDWNHEGYDDVRTKYTNYVDNIQKLKCCGLEDPSDWESLRPNFVPRDSYPFTCCSKNITDSEEVFKVQRNCQREMVEDVRGCHDLYRQIQNFLFYVSVAHITYLILLTPLSLLSQSTCCLDQAKHQDRSYTGVAYS